MDRKFRAVIGLLTAAIMLFSLAACAGESGKSSKAKAEKTDRTEGAQKVAETFLDDFTDFNFKAAAKSLDSGKWDNDGDDIESKDDLAELAIKNNDDSSVKEMKAAGVDFDGFFKDLIDMYELDYEIKSAKQNKDKTVEIKFEYISATPDEAIFDEKVNSADNEALLSEAGITEASTEEELYKAMGSIMQKMIDESIDEMKDKLKEETKDGVLVLEKKKGDWVVNAKKSKVDKKTLSEIIEKDIL